MTFASTSYVATAGQTEFVLPFEFVRGTFLTVLVDDVSTAAFTVSSGVVTYTGTALTAGQIVKIERSTPLTDDDQVIDFTSGAILTESDVETSRQQLLHICQELSDRLDTTDDSISGKPRGLTRVATGAIQGNVDATWFETTGPRRTLETPTWEADNATADTQWSIASGKLRLTLGTWRLRVRIAADRAFVAGSDSDIEVRMVDDVTGSGVTTYFASPSLSMRLAVGSRVYHEEVFELTLATQTDLNLLIRDTIAGSFCTLLAGSHIEVERVS